VLALIGQIPSEAIGKGFGLLHEIPDQLKILQSLTKYAARVTNPKEAIEGCQAAFTAMLSGRPRPVGIEVPQNCWKIRREVEFVKQSVNPSRKTINEPTIQQAVDMIARAKNPLILVGGGAKNSGEEVRRIAEHIQAPVSAFRGGHGILDARHYLSVTSPLGHQLWKDCDVVLAIGTRMQPQYKIWGIDDDLKIIRIEIDPEEMVRFGEPNIGIQGDVNEVLPILRLALQKQAPRPSSETKLLALKSAKAKEYSVLAPQYDYLQVIRAALPDDGIFVEELTQVGYVSRFAFPVYAPYTFLSTGYQGTLGWGFATALGAKCANPGKVVISVSGDGGFMFTASDMATAVQHNIGLIAIVFNDNAYGNVRRTQIEDFNGRAIASDLINPDFQKLAAAYGMSSALAKSPAELQKEIKEAIERGGPTLIEVPIGEVESPWSFLMLPKIRG
jgi:acetolactate synthase-1/2/3 large subunit